MRLALVVLLTACQSAPVRPCGLVVWYRGEGADVRVVGSWDDWREPGTALTHEKSGWRAEHFDLKPGDYSYELVVDGVAQPDPTVATTAFHADREVTWVRVDDCSVPRIVVDDARGSADGAAVISATFQRAGAPLLRVSARDRDGHEADVAADGDALKISTTRLPPGKHVFTLTATDERGKDAEAALATVWIEPAPIDARDLVVYQLVTDRFRDRDGAALVQPAIASERAGGHLAGITKAIEANALAGYNAILLSPLYDNPEGLFPGSDGRSYSGFHGYWPAAPRKLEPAVGTEAELDAMIRAAHARGIRVIFDVVPNHVHEQHVYFNEHPAWFNQGCVCGIMSCAWSETCWFTPYLPDLDWRQDAVLEQGALDVLYWVDRFDADGIRIDAVPLMPRAASRRIVAALRERFDHPGHRIYAIGENFTDERGAELIKRDLGPLGLDGDFHFPLLWAVRRVIAEESAPVSHLDDVWQASEDVWAGSGAVMGLTIGNHDVLRFASVSNHDQGDPWTPATTPSDPLVYDKQRLALSVIFALPGAPFVYYGDEIALAGHSDVDARRVLPDDATLSVEQAATKALVAKLTKLRACAEPLRRAELKTLFSDAERWVFSRGSVYVVVDRAPNATTPVSGLAKGDYEDVLSGERLTVSLSLTAIDPAPYAVRFFLPRGARCLE